VLKRTLIGACVLAVALAAWWIDGSRPGEPAWATAGLGMVLVLGALWELLSMGGVGGAVRPVTMLAGLAWTVVVAGAGMGPEALPDGIDHGILSAFVGPMHVASVLCGLLLALRLRWSGGHGVRTIARNPLIALAWVCGLAWLVHPLLAGRLDFVLGVVLTTKSSDIGAYFTGKFLGRHKMAPTISPKKTWEGAAGGVALPALVGAFLLAGVDVSLPVHDGQTVLLPSSPALAALTGAALGLVAIVSDLCESLVKRTLEVKDSGTIFGESGGFLDLADSLLLVAPLVLAYTAFLA
jgi:CDP-diglyceride synthetase